MLKDLNSILDYIDMLGQLDTKDVPPMAQVATLANEPTQAENGLEWGTRFDYAMRADEVKPCLTHEQAMMNAPDSDGTYFKVPKVIDKSGEVAQ